jgi:integrase/recombinase XerD
MNNGDKVLYKPGRPQGTGKGSARPLSIREIRYLYSSCMGRNGARNQAIITLQLHAGLRVGEVFGFKPSIIISGRNMKGKTSHTYYLSNRGQDILKQYVSTLDLTELNAPLFPSPKNGGFISPNAGAQLVRNLMKKSGIEDASSHSLRASFARRLLDKGVGVALISQALSHKNISTTISYLGDIAPKAENAVADLVF